MNTHECGTTKTCTKCKQTKPVSEFVNNRRTKDGKHYQCKACLKATLDAWRARNPEKVREQGRRNYANNGERFRAYSKQYAKDNPEKVRAATKRWEEANKDRRREQRRQKYHADREFRDMIKSHNSARHKRLKRATPRWVFPSDIRKVYLQAQRMTAETGVEHHVDHIVPLKGRKVSGLNVPWNLRVITATENMAKKNRVEDIV